MADEHPEDEGQTTRHREWRHIYKTRIRTSTAILVALFVAGIVLYGYTSQRYGVVAPPNPPPRTTTSTPTTTEPTTPWSSSTTTTGTSSATTTTGEGADDETGAPGEGGTQGTGGQSITTQQTIPGLPGVTIPNFGQQPQSTPVPTR
ncbi:hypothetical protein [Gordonia insulae]|uniref:Uncharacterized protein n=1 Tax=Gordonia insulae TaxID=2420509 RepID=A0A3G8JV34_9ACTN|nr:hypothetical protein [Gordonia insulae]AZG48615.1 hypothetical protein D7316_05233 [Gordonia insulae]